MVPAKTASPNPASPDDGSNADRGNLVWLNNHLRPRFSNMYSRIPVGSKRDVARPLCGRASRFAQNRIRDQERPGAGDPRAALMWS